MATSTESIESRLLLTMPDPMAMMRMMQQPPATGNLSISIDYRYISPDLVFNGVGDRCVDGEVRYHSAVPFIISGQATGPATLRITLPGGQVQTQDASGQLSMPFVFSTQLNGGNALTLKAELIDKNTGALISQALMTENVNAVSFRFEDYLGKIGNAADSQVTSQIASQLESLISPLLTDDVLTELALQRMDNDPTALNVDLTKGLIREELMSAKCVFAGSIDSGLRFGLQSAIEGDKLDHRFLMGSGHRSAAAFAESIAASKAAWNRELGPEDIPQMVSFGLGGLPSSEQLKNTVTGMHTEEDFIQMVDELSVTVGMKTPMVRLANGLGFSVGSQFTSGKLIVHDPSLSAIRVEATLDFLPPLGDPPVLFGPRMGGSIGGFYERSLFDDVMNEGSGANAFNLGAQWRY